MVRFTTMTTMAMAMVMVMVMATVMVAILSGPITERRTTVRMVSKRIAGGDADPRESPGEVSGVAACVNPIVAMATTHKMLVMTSILADPGAVAGVVIVPAVAAAVAAVGGRTKPVANIEVARGATMSRTSRTRKMTMMAPIEESDRLQQASRKQAKEPRLVQGGARATNQISGSGIGGLIVVDRRLFLGRDLHDW